MIDLLEKELMAQGIRPTDGGRCICRGQTLSLAQCEKNLLAALKENKRILLRLWVELSENIGTLGSGESSAMYLSMFVPALQSLYSLASMFPQLQNNGVVSALKKSLSADSNSFSRLVMHKVIEFRLAIDWMHHLVRKDLYLVYLIRSYTSAMKNRSVVARGVAGPWSNVDLPMQERVFEWKDIEEEVAGREQDKRNQPRYRMGLENYGTGDYATPNEGFYWRELRNDPYSFDDDSSNPYPHRNLLWV